MPSMRHVKGDGKSITLTPTDDAVEVVAAMPKRSWQRRLKIGTASSMDSFRLMPVSILTSFFHHLRVADADDQSGGDRTVSRSMAGEDFAAIEEFLYDTGLGQYERPLIPPFASAPVRSKPRRTYDPARPARDPEGDYVPMYLADVYLQNKRAWSRLKGRLEDFGQSAGLFDEISIKPLGSRQSEPFHVQVRKFAPGGRLKGPHRNLIDVGYGVSQVLPVITELLRADAPSTFLLQQPEVHLHPSAQAALGSLFCEVAGAKERLLVVETHSDHLLNRIRMDVRDGVGPLQPEDVFHSLLRARCARGQHPLPAPGSGRKRPGCATELWPLLHGGNGKIAPLLMCAIIDANVVHEVFGPDQSPAGRKFRNWVDQGSMRCGCRWESARRARCPRTLSTVEGDSSTDRQDPDRVQGTSRCKDAGAAGRGFVHVR